MMKHMEEITKFLNKEENEAKDAAEEAIRNTVKDELAELKKEEDKGPSDFLKFIAKTYKSYTGKTLTFTDD